MDGKCEGCQHNRPSSTDYCYMFEAKPEKLPCGQHDKYKDMRQATGRLLRVSPFLVHLMTIEAMTMTKEQKFFGNARQPMNNTIIKKETGHDM